MAASRHLVQSGVVKKYTDILAGKAQHLPVGNPATEQVALGPDHRRTPTRPHPQPGDVERGRWRQARRRRHVRKALLQTDSSGGRAHERASIRRRNLWSGCANHALRHTGSGGSYGGRHTVRAVARHHHPRCHEGPPLAEKIPGGLVHINNQTISDEAQVPFGVKESGAGSRIGGIAANIEAFTELEWVTLRTDVAPYPF